MNSTQRRALSTIYTGPAVNFENRLVNALVGLANNDKGWMAWIEKEITPGMDLAEATRLIEARAKSIAIKPYRYLFGASRSLNLIFSETWQFTSRGTLPPG